MSDLGTLGGTSSAAFGINALGQVVGSAQTTDGAHHAFLYKDGIMIDLGTLGGGFSRALAINASGQVVGFAYTTAGAAHAFLWQDGVMRDLGTLGGIDTVALDINASGQVVGGAYIHDGETRVGAWLWQNGVMTDLNTLLPPGRDGFLETRPPLMMPAILSAKLPGGNTKVSTSSAPREYPASQVRTRRLQSARRSRLKQRPSPVVDRAAGRDPFSAAAATTTRRRATGETHRCGPAPTWICGTTTAGSSSAGWMALSGSPSR